MPDKNNQNTHVSPSPVSCLPRRSLVRSRMSSTQATYPAYPATNSWQAFEISSITLFLPALPAACALVSCALPPLVPLCLRGYDSIMQNKPNSQNPKTAATSYAGKTYCNIQLPPRAEKQTQTNPIYRGETRLGRGEAGTNPTCRGAAFGEAGFPAIRNTQYDIRLPLGRRAKYEIRFTLHEIRHPVCLPDLVPP